MNVVLNKIRRVTSTEAQTWLDSQGRPHLVDFFGISRHQKATIRQLLNKHDSPSSISEEPSAPFQSA
jgi:hypothetical protein